MEFAFVIAVAAEGEKILENGCEYLRVKDVAIFILWQSFSLLALVVVVKLGCPLTWADSDRGACE